MLLAVTALKLIAEIALMALLGRWILGLLAGRRREDNLVYQVLGQVTRPLERLTRVLSPSLVLDRHIPLATAGLLATLWLVSTLLKVRVCLDIGVAQCL